MPPGTTAATETIAPRALRITVPTVLLDGHRPPQGFLHEQDRITIHADIVQVRDRYFLPGRHVEIVARRIEAEHGVIDVSGAPVTVSYDVARVDPSLDGTPAEPHGRPGADGEHGHDGGTLRIVAGEIVGDLSLVANGSAGGNSQRGGNGVAPAAAASGRDGKFTRHEPPAGVFGSEVVRSYGSRWYWERAFGEKGANAVPGGNAGPPGRAGDGGAGGHIEVSYVVVPEEPLRLIADGGAGGATGMAAKPGPPGKPGVGGRHLMYQYHFPGSTWEKFADDANGDVREIVHRFNIPPRASSGTESTQYGAVPEGPPPAVPGPPGSATGVPVAADDIAGMCDTGYLELICASAATDVAHGNVQRALERYGWVAALTRLTSDNGRAGLHKEVMERIEALRQQAPPAP